MEEEVWDYMIRFLRTWLKRFWLYRENLVRVHKSSKIVGGIEFDNIYYAKMIFWNIILLNLWFFRVRSLERIKWSIVFTCSGAWFVWWHLHPCLNDVLISYCNIVKLCMTAVGLESWSLPMPTEVGGFAGLCMVEECINWEVENVVVTLSFVCFSFGFSSVFWFVWNMSIGVVKRSLGRCAGLQALHMESFVSYHIRCKQRMESRSCRFWDCALRDKCSYDLLGICRNVPEEEGIAVVGPKTSTFSRGLLRPHAVDVICSLLILLWHLWVAPKFGKLLWCSRKAC